MQIIQLLNRLKHWNCTVVSGQIIALGLITSVLFNSTSAVAANTVILKYGKFHRAVSVKELSEFVETGKTTPPIEGYLQAANQKPALARKALVAGIKADPAFLNSLLSSWAGPILVDQIGEVVHPPAKQLDKQALHKALAGSISQTSEVSLLGAIRNYPDESVELDGDRLIVVYQRLSQMSKGF